MHLVVNNLELKLGKRNILQGIHLQLPQGKIYAVLGAAGSGKTMLVECLAGLRKPDAGELFLRDEPLDKRSARMRLGIVFSKANFFRYLPIGRNLQLHLSSANRDENGEDAIHRVCERLRVSHLTNALPDDLNAWQTLQMQLARALLNQPEVLLLDTPFEQIPVGHHNALRMLLAEEAERGTTLLFTTSLPRQAELVADRIALLEQGVIIQDASPQEFFTRPHNLFVANVFYDQGFGVIPGVFTKRLKTAFECTLLDEYDARIACRSDKLLDYFGNDFLLGVQSDKVSFTKPKESAIRIKGRLLSCKQLHNHHISLWRLGADSTLEVRSGTRPKESATANLWITIAGLILFDEYGAMLTVL